jgi:Flp pilus assembly protein TadB
MGLAFLVSGLLFVAFDWVTHWEWIWPTAVGLKLVLAAVVFLLWWWIKRNRK